MSSKVLTLVDGRIQQSTVPFLQATGDNVAFAGLSMTSGYVGFFTDPNTISGSANYVWDITNNRLGVGTNTPLAAVHIQAGNATALRLSSAVGQGSTLMSYGAGGNSDALFLATNAAYSGAAWNRIDTTRTSWLLGFGSSNGDNFTIQRSDAGSNPITWGTESFTINVDGNVAIGHANPLYKFDVNGIIRGKGDIYVTKGSSAFIGATDNFDLRFGVNTTEYLRIRTTGLVETARDFTANGQTSIVTTDAGTTNAVTSLLSQHLSSDTPAASFGIDWLKQSHSSTNAIRTQLQIRTTWATATDASRKARTDFVIFDTAARTVLRLEASGSAAMIGFLGAAAVARPTVTGSRGGNAALTSLLTALANLGLVTNSSS